MVKMSFALIVYVMLISLSQGSNYFPTSITGSWSSVSANCQANGAQLATFSTEADVSAIFDACETVGGYVCFLGFHDNNLDSQFEFVDGEILDHNAWNLWINAQEPHGVVQLGSNHACGCMAGSNYFGNPTDSYTTSLADCHCPASLYGICETSDSTTPNPTPPPTPVPTPNPTPQPIIEEDDNGCVTSAEYNVQFLIDESGSVPRSGYELSIDFIQGLIMDDISPSAKISVFEFASNFQLIYGFDDTQYPRDDMIAAIEAADYNRGGTYTARAIQAAINELDRAEAAGELNDDATLLFLITDGQPSDNPCPLKSALDDRDVTVIIIGVGSFNRARVDCLAVNDRDTVIEVAGFSSDAFDAVEEAVAVTTCPPPCDNCVIVPPDPLPCKEAQEYCKNTFGTNLATIIDDDDRTAAQDALNTAGEPFGFIGLYSDDIETKWQFRSGDTCPSDSAYRCVDFWRAAPGGFENRPRCIGPTEGGFGCAVIYADDGTVDNDILDTAPFAFLCDEP